MIPARRAITVADLTAILEPADYTAALRRRWGWIVLGAISGLTLAAVFLYFFPPQYQSQAVVRFNPPQVAERYVNANDSMQAEQRLFALTQMLTSAVTARKQIETQQLYKKLRHFYTVEDLVPRFQKNLTVRRVNLAGVDPKRALPSLYLSFRADSPEAARRVLTQLVESIHEANRGYRGDQSNGTTEFLKMQAEGLQERILELETQLGELGMFDRVAGDHQWAMKIQQLYSVENRLGHVRTSMRNLQRDRAEKANELAEQEARLRKVNVLVNPRSEFPSIELQSLRRRAEDARVAYERVLERYRPDYPDAVEARRVMDNIARQVELQEERELEIARQRMRRDISARIDLLKGDVRGLDEAIKEQQAEELSLARQAATLRQATQNEPETDVEYLRLTREYEVLKEFHRTLAKKQQEAQVSSEMERLGRGEAIEVVEPPSLPTAASGFNWQFMLLAGFLGGACLAALAAVCAHVYDPVVSAAHHLSLWQEAPLLAALPPALLPAPSPVFPRGFRVRVRWKRGAWLGLILPLLLQFPSGCQRRPVPEKLLAQAQSLEQQGELRKAMLLYRQVLKTAPRTAAAHEALARLELDFGDVDKGHAHLLRTVELQPGAQEPLLKLAELTYLLYVAESGRSEPALLELESVAERLSTRWPNSPQGPIYQSLALRERHRTDQAAEVLETAIARLGPEPSLVTQLAALEYQRGQKARALERLEQLLAGGTTYAPAYDLAYLQRMQERQPMDARRVLESKWAVLGSADAALQLAAHLHATGQTAPLEAHLAAFRAKHASQPETLIQLGDFWLHRGERNRARAHYQEGLQRFPAQRAAFRARLTEWSLLFEGRDAAAVVLREALKEDPKDGHLRAQRAALEIDAARPEELAQCRLELELILQGMPRSSFVRYHLGRTYLRLGDVLKARQQFDRSVRLDPNYAPGWIALAETDVRLGNLATAQTRLDRVLAHAPNLPAALLLKAQVQAGRGQAAEAGQTLDQLEALGAGNVEAKLQQASLRLLAGQPAQAGRLLEEVLRAAPSEERAFILMARMDAATGKLQSAMQRIDAALLRQPGSELLASERAMLALAGGQWEVAERAFRDLRQRFPDQPGYTLGLADSLASGQRTQEALGLYRQLHQARPDYLRAWLHAGALLSERNDFAAARAAYEKALALQPDDPVVLNNLAYTLARSGHQLEKAMEYAQQALRMMPGSLEIQDTLLYTQLRLGLPQQARATLDTMIARAPEARRAPLRQLAQHLDHGRLAEARAAMEGERDRARAAASGGQS